MPARAVILAANEVQDCLLFFPYHVLAAEGVKPDVAGPRVGRVVGENGYALAANVCLSDAGPSQYDLLIVPGLNGREHICLDRAVSRVVGQFIAAGKAFAPFCRQGRIGLRALGCDPKSCAATAAAMLAGRTWQCPDELPASCRRMFQALRATGACPAQTVPRCCTTLETTP
jgi:putative intracellular protease/amidase